MNYLMFRQSDMLNEKVTYHLNKEKTVNHICLDNCIFHLKTNDRIAKTLMDTLFIIDLSKLDYDTDKHIFCF